MPCYSSSGAMPAAGPSSGRGCRLGTRAARRCSKRSSARSRSDFQCRHTVTQCALWCSSRSCMQCNGFSCWLLGVQCGDRPAKRSTIIAEPRGLLHSAGTEANRHKQQPQPGTGTHGGNWKSTRNRRFRPHSSCGSGGGADARLTHLCGFLAAPLQGLATPRWGAFPRPGTTCRLRTAAPPPAAPAPPRRSAAPAPAAMAVPAARRECIIM